MSAKTLRGMLVGPPNCGKSTLFNMISGASVPVGNRAGVTVNIECRKVKGKKICFDCADFYLYDLPGLRSFEGGGEDEKVTVRMLTDGHPDFIINVINAVSLDACLPLTLELIEKFRDIPVICAVNMCDELEKQKIKFMPRYLEKYLGIDVVRVSAVEKGGTDALKTEIAEILKSAAAAGVTRPRTAVAGLRVGKRAGLSTYLYPRSPEVRAAYAARAAAASLTGKVKPHLISDRTDRILTSPLVGMAVFLIVMSVIFMLVFGKTGDFLTDIFRSTVFEPLTALLYEAEGFMKIPPVAVSLINGCVVNGVGAVVSFMPRITLMYILLSLLEDSGYTERAAFVMDAPMRFFGMSGRAFIPALLGLGCTVPAILSARTITDAGERRRCIMFAPLISCSARLPVYVMIAGTFFPRCSFFIVLLIYLLGNVVFLLLCGTVRRTEKQETPLFVTELPRYRMPRLKIILKKTCVRLSEFLRRAGGAIFVSSVVVWLCTFFTPSFRIATCTEESLLCKVSGRISFLFSPLGFGDWRLVSALMAGVGAKEAVVSALGVLFGGDFPRSLISCGALGTESAISFIVFVSMYFPCLATVSVMAKELKSKKRVAAALVMMFLCAYFCSFSVYRISLLI